MREINLVTIDPETGDIQEQILPLLTKNPLRLGWVVVTKAAERAVPRVTIENALSHHQLGDWGVCCPEDWRTNNRARKYGARILSVYEYGPEKEGGGRDRFWIITEADRSCTTVLLPSDY